MRTIALAVLILFAACSTDEFIVDGEQAVGVYGEVPEDILRASPVDDYVPICEPPVEATCGYQGLPCCAKDGQGGTGGSLDPGAHCVDDIDVVWNPSCSGTP